MAIITLTTDFGTRDGYVGALKGVLARRAQDTVLVDIAHDIPAGDIAHAAWVVGTSANEFPYGTIHLVIVDPGVGGARRGVIISSSGQWYVGPDNGVFAYVADRRSSAWAIESTHLLGGASRTFHGRDVFAPVAASLSRGEDAATWGPATQLTGELPWGARPEREGRVVHVDRFGNLISDLPRSEAGTSVTIAGRTLALVGTYEDVASGELLAYIGSAKTVEIAVRDGRADRILEAPRGTAVRPGGAAGPYR
ncbi:MAG: SAM-dependent chlorinase/fluorinase [Myxococcales bacterium]|nr:SAM-dependent chlorinase/fluorinase [Myxococcales bacterium]